MTKLTEFLARVEELEKKASSAEGMYLERADWDNGESSYEIHQGDHVSGGMFVAFRTEDHNPPLKAKANAELFLACRTDLPKFVALVKEMREALEFYSDRDHWDDDPFNPTIWNDDGNIDLGKQAIKALEKCERIVGDE